VAGRSGFIASASVVKFSLKRAMPNQVKLGAPPLT